jgi:hypothetical protein
MSQYAPESVKSRDHVKGFHNQTDAISTEGVSLLGIDPATNQLYSDGKRPVLRDRIVTLGALNGFFCRACRHWHMRRLLLTFCFVQLSTVRPRQLTFLSAITALGCEPGGGLIVMPDSFNIAHRDRLMALALAMWRHPPDT